MTWEDKLRSFFPGQARDKTSVLVPYNNYSLCPDSKYTYYSMVMVNSNIKIYSGMKYSI